MKSILDTPLDEHQAGLWFLGQAGYIFRSQTLCVAIDPYLSDSVARVAPEFGRLYPPPLDPADLRVDIYVVTHDHLDHLDPETIQAYRHKEHTLFVAPRLACRKLAALGIPPVNIIRIDSGETLTLRGATITGIYALPSEADVIDTTGYRIQFDNGRSIYHTSDTEFSELLLKCAPQAEVVLACINGKDGNMGAQAAARVAKVVTPRVAAIPNHYDLMALNAENPQVFTYFAGQECPDIPVKILQPLESLIW
ncbi:MAG: MBL fold metallo-hydrolase [Anaerolineae bacterium]|nr:MBL fold metallo-hydrolase [Anaerolineae bacterium]